MITEKQSENTFYEYGAMASKFQLEAKNKLTAYATMVLHYDRAAHMIAIYAPVECQEDNWMNLTGQISDRLDEVFGGAGSFDKYVKEHLEDIKLCYKSIKRLV